MLRVTKQFEFCYAHHLPRYEGKCANLHGHNATLEVTVQPTESAGLIDAPGLYPGMVIDFGDLKRIVGEVLEGIDHRNLNEWLAVPTCENLIQYLAVNIQFKLPPYCKLHSLRLSETGTSWATWEVD